MIEPFVGIADNFVGVFDLGQDRLPNFAAYRFLYERLIGCSAARGCRRPSAPQPLCRTFTPNAAGSCCSRSARALRPRRAGRAVRPRVLARRGWEKVRPLRLAA